MTTDNPLIGWLNLAKNAQATVTVGTIRYGSNLNDAFEPTPDMPAVLECDAAGEVHIQFTPDFRDKGWGNFRWGLEPLLGYTVDALIIGASRHDAAGFHFESGAISLFADTTQILNTKFYAPKNESALFIIDPHTRGSIYTLKLTGFPPNATVVVPLLFMGSTLRMPYLNFGYDTYPDKSHGEMVEYSAGNTWHINNFLRIEAKPRWDGIYDELWSSIDAFREFVTEKNEPFWWCAMPASEAWRCYLVKQKGDIHFPIRDGFKRPLSLHLIEVL